MIKLTTLSKVLTEAAEKKLDELQSQFLMDEQEPEEDMWSKMGIQRPPGMESEEQDPLTGFTFEETDFKYVEGKALVKPSRIDLILQTEQGSEVYMESSKSFTTRETPEEIERLIEKG